MITLVDDRGCCWQRGFLLLLLGVLFRSIFVTSFCHIMPLFWRGGCRCHLLHFHCIERALGAISIAVLVVTFMTAGLYTVLYFPCTSTKYRYLIIQYSVPLFPVPTRFVMIFSSLWHDLWINESVTDSLSMGTTTNMHLKNGILNFQKVAKRWKTNTWTHRLNTCSHATKPTKRIHTLYFTPPTLPYA